MGRCKQKGKEGRCLLCYQKCLEPNSLKSLNGFNFCKLFVVNKESLILTDERKRDLSSFTPFGCLECLPLLLEGEKLIRKVEEVEREVEVLRQEVIKRVEKRGGSGEDEDKVLDEIRECVLGGGGGVGTRKRKQVQVQGERRMLRNQRGKVDLEDRDRDVRLEKVKTKGTLISKAGRVIRTRKRQRMQGEEKDQVNKNKIVEDKEDPAPVPVSEGAQDKEMEMEDELKQKKGKRAKRKRNKKTAVPVTVLGEDGERYEALFMKDREQDEDLIQTNQVIQMNNAREMPQIRFKCREDRCQKLFQSFTKMRVHFRTTHLGDVLECLTCSLKLDSQDALKSHVKEHGDKTPEWLPDALKCYKCDYEGCEQSFRKPSTLETHIREVHTHEKPYCCDHCEEKLASKLKLNLHIEHAHPNQTPFKCDACPKGFLDEERFKKHYQMHTGERSYLCEICSKSFSQPAYLKYHQTMHEELDLPKYTCDECDRVFATPVNLKLHKKTQHNKEFRYNCEICGHGASHLSHLRFHMLTHSKARPHSCNICNKSFPRSSQLKIHLRNHTGERPYVCPTCNKGFMDSSKLRRHQQSHGDSKPYSCEVCDKGFMQASSLNAHMKISHGTSATKKLKTVRKKVTKDLNLKHTQVSDKMVTQDTSKEPEGSSYHLEIQTPNVFGPGFGSLPIQFQVVTEDELGESEGQYAEFIIVNHHI